MRSATRRLESLLQTGMKEPAVLVLEFVDGKLTLFHALPHRAKVAVAVAQPNESEVEATVDR